jgi:hypothetical protein
MFNKMPDDPFFEEMDPVQKAWMFFSWAEDYGDEFKLLENQGYLIASFTNPEAVKKVLGAGAQKHMSTDEEFEKTSQEVFGKIKQINEEENSKASRRKKHRKIQT